MDKITLFYGTLDESIQWHWLALCYPLLTAYLDLDAIEVVVIDQRLEKERTLSLIEKHVSESLFLGISSFTGYQLERSLDIAHHVKTRFPHVPIVWGGAHATALPLQSLQDPCVDIVVPGRGETIMPRLIAGLKQNTLDNVPDIYWKDNHQVKMGVQHNEIVDYDALPQLHYDVLDVKRYINPETKILNLTTSWGCSNRCTFCFWYKNHNPWSGFNPQRVLREVTRFIEGYGVQKIDFNESNYFNDIHRALEIARLLIPLNISYSCTARVDDLGMLTPEDFTLLARSGCFAIFIGLESGSARILKLMNKKINLDDLVTAAANARHTNINLFLSLLFQIPGEKIEDICETSEYVQKLIKINPHVRRQTCSFTPLPNLPLTRSAIKQGFREPQNMRDWTRVVKRSRFEHKPWMSDADAREYDKVFNELFPESQHMEYSTSPENP